MAFTIDLPEGYQYLLFSVCGIIFQCFMTGGQVMTLRKKLFTPEFLEKHFGKEHEKVYGKPIGNSLGYPDMGDGLYSDHLTYKEWYDLNNAQRTHGNFVENVFLIVPLLLIAGLEYPGQAANAGVVYFLGRLIYTIGYKQAGPKGRMVGAGLALLSLMTTLGFAGFSAYYRYHKGNGLLYFSVISVVFACFFAATLVSKARGKYFNKDFMEKHFGKEHEQTFGKKIEPRGYPDMGNGRYAQKLSPEDWYKFNCAQRGHLNFIEFIGGIIPLTLLAGFMNYTFYAAILGFTMAAGRIIYAIGYNKGGPKGRLIGAILTEVPLVIVLGMACHNAYLLARPALAKWM